MGEKQGLIKTDTAKGSCMPPLGSILRMRLSRCLAGHVYMPEKGAMDGHTGFNHRPATHALHV